MPRKQKKYHFIYKTTNKINGKYYIGLHTTNNIEDGYLGSGKYLRYSVNKYGPENFEREILEYYDNTKDLKDRERQLVDDKLLNDPMCMNLTYGGDGNWEYLNSNSDVQRKKAIKSNAKQKILRETDPKWVEQRFASASKAMIEQYRSGDRVPNMPDWNGKKHRDETKKKISIKSSLRESGKGNSQYGTKWMYHKSSSRPKKVKRDEIEIHVKQGWQFGRKRI